MDEFKDIMRKLLDQDTDIDISDDVTILRLEAWRPEWDEAYKEFVFAESDYDNSDPKMLLLKKAHTRLWTMIQNDIQEFGRLRLNRKDKTIEIIKD